MKTPSPIASGDYSASRLAAKAFTNLGRIIKTEYILPNITDPALRSTVQLQLNNGEFTTGDYEEIMNKASSLSLVSNTILYWNTSRIQNIVENLRKQGEQVEDKTLSHISLLPYKHVLPNGNYFNDIEVSEG